MSTHRWREEGQSSEWERLWACRIKAVKEKTHETKGRKTGWANGELTVGKPEIKWSRLLGTDKKKAGRVSKLPLYCKRDLKRDKSIQFYLCTWTSVAERDGTILMVLPENIDDLRTWGLYLFLYDYPENSPLPPAPWVPAPTSISLILERTSAVHAIFRGHVCSKCLYAAIMGQVVKWVENKEEAAFRIQFSRVILCSFATQVIW